MTKYKSIAVIYGSDSSENEVSCRSGEFTASRIDPETYDVYQIYARFGRWQLVQYRKKNSMPVTFPESARPEIDKSDFSVKVLGEKIKFDFAYIMQHGRPGENGQIEGYLEMISVPHSTCSSYVSAIAFDKYSCKCYLEGLPEVKLAPSVLIREGEDPAIAAGAVSSKLQYPVFVKPTDAGSSFGITKVYKSEDLSDAVNYAFSESPTVLVEQGVKGREVTCAAYFDGKSIKTLPVVEIVTENDYFDYDAKYNGHSREVCPACLDEPESRRIQDAAVSIYRRLGCKGVVRFDFIMAVEGLYFLEANTIPGMTSASLVPKMVAAAGMDITDFLSTIIECA